MLAGLGAAAAASACPGIGTAAAAPKPPKGEVAIPGSTPTQRAWARRVLRSMSLEQKVGQVFNSYVHGADAVSVTEAEAAENVKLYGVRTPAEVVQKYQLGGIIYFAWSNNVANPSQIATLSNGLQEAALADGRGLPLTISTDQEQGLVTRIGAPATLFPGAMALGATRSDVDARKAGRVTGEELRAMGITMDFAPVADVNVNPANPVIGVRSSGSDPQLVADVVAAQVKGLQSAKGVSATAKHFPGHGDTATDSHYGLPVITHTREQWEATDLPPFQAAIEADGVDVRAVFGPEHGFRGTAQAGASEQATKDPRTGIDVYDAYGASDAKFATMFTAAGVDTVVFDIQDVGARFYTYIWTMYQAMRGAALAGGIRFVVLDRPNPVGRRARGPMLLPAYPSGVGLRPILMQHGMTVGELATMFNAEYLPKEPGGAVLEELEVVEVSGWKGQLFAETGLPWVMPSPNMPTPDTALLYPGTCLFEATNMSEGRGTTRPFELIGAPYVDQRWAERLNDHDLPGVAFREAYFTPTMGKNANKVNGGVQVHITDPARVDAPATAVHMLVDALALYPAFDTRVVPSDPYPWIWLDKLSGTTDLRTQLTGRASAQQIIERWAPDERAWTRRRRRYLRY